MTAKIEPGSRISVTVKKNPTNEAAAKTLSRLFAKDPAHRKTRTFRKKLLRSAVEVRRRGGRPWEVRSKAPRLVQPVAGDACNVLVTVDMLGDIASVRRFIDVKKA
jgi:hypothetical protein